MEKSHLNEKNLPKGITEIIFQGLKGEKAGKKDINKKVNGFFVRSINISLIKFLGVGIPTKTCRGSIYINDFKFEFCAKLDLTGSRLEYFEIDSDYNKSALKE